MSSSPEATAPAVKASIDVRRLPWVRPLVATYANDFASVASLYGGDPADPGAWRETIRRIQNTTRDRAAVAALIGRQLEQRQAPPEARDAAALLEKPDTVAVVTGQQAGLFGGPLYTLLKAINTLQLAERVRVETGVPAVAVFWIDEEDHDWNEIRTAQVLDANSALRSVTVPDVEGAGSRPIASLVLNEGINAALDELVAVLTPTEFTGEVVAGLRAHYRPGAGMGRAFAGWLDRLLGRHGLIVFESADVTAKPLAADLFAREVGQPGRTSTLARQAATEMARLGHEPQVEPSEDSVALFYLDGGGRRAIKWRGPEFAVDDRPFSAAALQAEVQSSPARFSPNVLLRPLVQDRLFPTVCYVGGPSELAYQAQLKTIYREFGVEVPLLYSRTSVTLLDSSALRFLEKHQLTLDALHAQDDSALNKLLESQLPPSIERTMDDAERDLALQAQALKREVSVVDPTLVGAVDTTVERIQESLKTLHHKIIQATKRKDETLRRQFVRTRMLAFPGGQPQERILNLAFFLNRHGWGLCDRLLEMLPLEMGKHYVMTV
jgi:bacillithiol biosynthesis cysteine-adding enzyme BshC